MNYSNLQNNDNLQEEMENMKQAQLEMRNNYIWGATGIVVSGFMWLLSGLVAYNYSPKQAVWTLLIGGVLIHPISTIVNKILGVSGTHSKNNALGNLAMEGTFFMLMCIPLAYGLSLLRTEWFFQGMLMIIGGRYLTFNTLYGNRLFWIIGATLGIAGYLLYSLNAQSYVSALTGSIIEISYGAYMYIYSRRTQTIV
jgi:hypothetical protein